jgi:hydroxymethylglutaryl-CoA reductase
MTYELSGFHKLPFKKRVKIIKGLAKLSKDDIKTMTHTGSLEPDIADIMIENVIGTTQIPVGVATNFIINGKDYLVPMAIEESSVVAAASHAAKLARPSGGFKASSDEPIMIGQIQLMDVKNVQKSKKDIISRYNEIKSIVESKDSILLKLGGGLKGIELREVESHRGKMLIVHLFVDVRDAMGANAVNTYCEQIAPYLEHLTGGRSVLKIISNLAVKRMVRTTAVWKKEVIGSDVVDGILDAYAFAMNDPFRAATHNKGIMNGVDSVIIATSNDWRAVEAGAHAYATITGEYLPLTRYEKNSRGDLVGKLEMPLAVGLVGGATRIHPVAKVMLKILGVKTAKELAEVAASVGLANNFAAMRAMVSEGIRKGHMKLHASNIAANAGAHGKEMDMVAKILVKEDNISVSRAHDVLKDIRTEYRKRKIRRIVKKVRHQVEKVKRKRKRR